MYVTAAARVASVQQVPGHASILIVYASKAPRSNPARQVHTMQSLLLQLSQNAIPSVVHTASARHRQSLIRPRLVAALCAADGPASSSNGSKPDAPEPDDPVAAMMWAAQQDGVQVLFDEFDEDADYDDILEDLEDPWMRNLSRKQCCCLSSKLFLQQLCFTCHSQAP